MARGIFKHLTILAPPKTEDVLLNKWLDQTVRELQRFSKDVANFLVQDVAVARVSTQTVAAGFQVMSDGLFVELYSAGAVTSNATMAIRPGVIGSWLIIHNRGASAITIKNNAGTKLGADIVLGTNDVLTVRYDGVDWIKVALGDN